jgi:serine/threonine protein kinase
LGLIFGRIKYNQQKKIIKQLQICNNNECRIENASKPIRKVFSTGKSGDIVLQLRENKVIKLSMDQKRIENEVVKTLAFYKVFEEDKTYEPEQPKPNPIIKILEYNIESTTCEYNNMDYYYYMMEDLNNTNDQGYEYLSLDKIIMDNCKSPQVDYILLKTLFKKLFNVIKILKTALNSHCDLHTQNVFYNKQKHQMKIIDLGLAQTDSIKCEKQRSLTMVIIKNYIKCKKVVRLAGALIRLPFEKEIDSDLSMFFNIVGLFFYDPEIFKIFRNDSKQFFLNKKTQILDNIENNLNKLLNI